MEKETLNVCCNVSDTLKKLNKIFKILLIVLIALCVLFFAFDFNAVCDSFYKWFINDDVYADINPNSTAGMISEGLGYIVDLIIIIVIMRGLICITENAECNKAIIDAKYNIVKVKKNSSAK